MNADRTKLADRILKLLALAQGTSFEAEAETARRMADELMAKHNISPTEGAKDRDQFVVELYHPRFKGMRWEFMLADAVAVLCGCKAYWNGDFAVFKFAGLVPEVEACLYIVAKLHEQRITEWLAYKVTGPDSFHKFCYAYAIAVSDKIEALSRPMPALREARKAAQLWFEAGNKVFSEDVRLGAASSEAGLSAGKGASLHRGELGGAQRQRFLR